MRNVILLLVLVILASCSQHIYVVRHAEKAAGVDPATMTSYTDPPLTPEGQERALKLKEILGSKNIRHIFSTNTLRTRSTAMPLKELFLGMPLEIYPASKDSVQAFAARIRSIRKGDILIVGHSNTVDDILNAISGKTLLPGDLKDTEYDHLFILTRKGDRYRFTRTRYGKPTSP